MIKDRVSFFCFCSICLGKRLGKSKVKAICKGLHPNSFSKRSLEHYCVCVCLRWTGNLPADWRWWWGMEKKTCEVQLTWDNKPAVTVRILRNFRHICVVIIQSTIHIDVYGSIDTQTWYMYISIFTYRLEWRRFAVHFHLAIEEVAAELLLLNMFWLVQPCLPISLTYSLCKTSGSYMDTGHIGRL